MRVHLFKLLPCVLLIIPGQALCTSKSEDKNWRINYYENNFVIITTEAVNSKNTLFQIYLNPEYACLPLIKLSQAPGTNRETAPAAELYIGQTRFQLIPNTNYPALLDLPNSVFDRLSDQKTMRIHQLNRLYLFSTDGGRDAIRAGFTACESDVIPEVIQRPPTSQRRHRPHENFSETSRPNFKLEILKHPLVVGAAILTTLFGLFFLLFSSRESRPQYKPNYDNFWDDGTFFRDDDKQNKSSKGQDRRGTQEEYWSSSMGGHDGKDTPQDNAAEDSARRASLNRFFLCPGCNITLQFDVTLSKSSIKCPSCHHDFAVWIDKAGSLYIESIVASTHQEDTPRLNTVEECLLFLGLPQNASRELIRRTYKQRISQYHPDKVSNLGKKLQHLAEEEAKNLNIAMRVLEDFRRV